MITDSLAKISAAAILTFGQITTNLPSEKVLSSHEISLENRYSVKSVSDVFKDNILLNLAYMDNKITSKNINWDEVKKPFQYEFRLNPGETFAYHDDILPEYKDSLVKTTQAHFNASEGFKTDGYLYGDGVCHLASLMYWVALDAGLDAKAPTGHDFMAITEIDKKYGVSIYSNPFARGSHAQQNLYIKNNKEKPVAFQFEYLGDKLKLTVIEFN